MATAPAVADFQLPSTESLRRNALTRSARRNAQVARRRIVWRWAVWLAGLALRWAVLPALLVASLIWLLDRSDDASPTLPGAQPAPLTPASPPAPSPPGLNLRMDDAVEASAVLPRRKPQAQSGGSPNDFDRSSSER